MSKVLKKSYKIIKIVIKSILLLAVMAYLSWWGFEYFWYKGILPEKIGVSFPVSINGQTGFIKGCGAAIFMLKDSTVDSTKKEGIDFFKNATFSRSNKDHYHTFQPWMKTPAPNSNRDGFMPGLGCSKSIIFSIIPIKSWVHEAARKPGNYYTTKPEGEILVIPGRKIVVFTYFG